jgi:hypothetical protein
LYKSGNGYCRAEVDKFRCFIVLKAVFSPFARHSFFVCFAANITNMKKKIYIILLCCGVQPAFSQIKTNCCCEDTSYCAEMDNSLRQTYTDKEKKISIVKELIYDFKSKDIKLPEKWQRLKKGDWLRLKVMNYNPYLYKLVIDHKDSSVAAVNDGKLLGWFLDPTNLGNIVANIKGAGNVTAPQSLVNLMGNMNEGNGIASAHLQFAFDSTIKSKRLQKKQFDLLASDFEKYKIEATADEIIEDQKNKVDAQEKNFKQKSRNIENTQYAISRKFAILRTLYPDDCRSFEKLKDSIKTDIETPIKQIRADLSQMDDKAAVDFKNYLAQIAPHMETVLKTPVLRVKDSLIKLFYKAFALTVFKADSSINNKNMGDIIARLEAAALLRSCYVSFPMQVTEDIKKITVDFKPWGDSLRLPSYTNTVLLPLVQPKIWGVSSGINISGLSNEGFVNKTIAKVLTGADSVYQLVPDNQGDVQIGINALAYVGWKSNKDNDKPNYWGISFGAGMTIESKPKPRVLLGGSFITGEKNRVLFTLGFIGGPVSKLSNGYEAGAAYNKPATDFLKDVLGVSGFFSINYSFLSK